MITKSELTEIGSLNQPHGIKGEISATIEVDIDPESLDCIVLDIDGIFVPFFVTAVRPKGRDTVLLTIDDVTSEPQAASLRGKTLYVPTDRYPEIEEDNDEADSDGFYVEDLIGFIVEDSDGNTIGEIADYDDSTENRLFIIEREDGTRLLIPIADEYFEEIDPKTGKIIMDLPTGLLNI